MTKTVAIVHFNTPRLTAALVQSVRKHTDVDRIVIFDNSDRYPFPATDGVEVIDNTAGRVIDFEQLVLSYPDRKLTCNEHASSKHIASVDKLFDILPDGFVLMDSDILIKMDFSCFFDARVAWSGMLERIPLYNFMATPRLLPYLAWINVPVCRKHGIRFWHEGYAYKLSHQGAPYYDTGASFLMDCKTAGLPGTEINIYDYMVHLVGASYSSPDVDTWLKDHRDLYE